MIESTIGKWVIAMTLSIIAILSPIHPIMGAVGALIAIDFVTGIMAARKRGEAITSRAMSRTVYKMVVYQLAVISGFAMQYLIGETLPIAKLCAAAIGMIEFKSLAENVRIITGVRLDSLINKIQDREKP
jgi:hypothetical protein